MTNHEKAINNTRVLALVDKKSALLECNANIYSTTPNDQKRDWIALKSQIEDDYTAEVMDTYADNRDTNCDVWLLFLIVLASIVVFILGKLL